MFVVIKKRTVVTASILLVLVVVASVLFATLLTAKTKAVAGETFTVVLDAGHGGIDGGVRGVDSNTYEREVNLNVVMTLKGMLEERGVNVVLTRTDENGLYDNTQPGFKKRDLDKRREIIIASNADCLLSIHCNKFPDASRRGAQCFFEPTSTQSVALATAIQGTVNTLNEREIKRGFSPLKGDYYMLKCTTIPSAIVECGFLSNPQDDKLLNTESYIAELASAIASGIMEYKEKAL